MVMSKYSTDEMRLEALGFIERARERRMKNPNHIRLFTYPKGKINFEANSIDELLNLKDIEAKNPEYITEPPLLMDFSLEELRKIHQHCVETGIKPLEYLGDEKLCNGDQRLLKLGQNLSSLKCHSMDNEKAVQMTTKAVKKHIGHDDQKGAIILTKDSVDQLPINTTKRDFKNVCKKLEF